MKLKNLLRGRAPTAAPAESNNHATSPSLLFDVQCSEVMPEEEEDETTCQITNNLNCREPTTHREKKELSPVQSQTPPHYRGCSCNCGTPAATTPTTNKKSKKDCFCSNEPRKFDVLFGRGKPYQGHAGNVRLHIIVDIHRSKYLTSGREAKTCISEEIVRVIKNCGVQPGRFLKYCHDAEEWVEVPDEVARQKVSHLLRSVFFREKDNKSNSNSINTNKNNDHDKSNKAEDVTTNTVSKKEKSRIIPDVIPKKEDSSTVSENTTTTTTADKFTNDLTSRTITTKKRRSKDYTTATDSTTIRPPEPSRKRQKVEEDSLPPEDDDKEEEKEGTEVETPTQDIQRDTFFSTMENHSLPINIPSAASIVNNNLPFMQQLQTIQTTPLPSHLLNSCSAAMLSSNLAVQQTIISRAAQAPLSSPFLFTLPATNHLQAVQGHGNSCPLVANNRLSFPAADLLALLRQQEQERINLIRQGLL